MRLLMGLLAAMVLLVMYAPGVTAAIVAQERAPERASVQAERMTPARTETRRASLQRAEGPLQVGFQRALESGETARIMTFIAPSAQTAGDYSADNTLEFICNGGNCACAGAFDCVDMIDEGVCNEETVGCNDYGCTCQASEG